MNISGLVQTLNYILEHPETWNQRKWHCETSHCFAGHGQINAGKDINKLTCFEDAQEWYDLNREDAGWLFASYRTLPEIHAFVYAATKGDPYLYDDGYDHFGFNSMGYDRWGYDGDGFNSDGDDRDGYDREGFDRYGFNRYGFNSFGYDKNGYDRNGYDDDGYDRAGYARAGYNHEGFNRAGFNREGFDRSGNRLPLL